MEQQQTQLNDQIKELKQEINNLRANMTLLDQEKDRLLVNEIVQQITLLFHKTMIYKIDHLFIYLFIFSDGIGRENGEDCCIGTRIDA